MYIMHLCTIQINNHEFLLAYLCSQRYDNVCAAPEQAPPENVV